MSQTFPCGQILVDPLSQGTYHLLLETLGSLDSTQSFLPFGESGSPVPGVTEEWFQGRGRRCGEGKGE